MNYHTVYVKYMYLYVGLPNNLIYFRMDPQCTLAFNKFERVVDIHNCANIFCCIDV